MDYYLDANGTDGTDPSLTDRVYSDGTRIVSDDARAIAGREAKAESAEARRKELVARVRKVTDDPPNYSDANVRDAIGALAELAGAKL